MGQYKLALFFALPGLRGLILPEYPAGNFVPSHYGKFCGIGA